MKLVKPAAIGAIAVCALFLTPMPATASNPSGTASHDADMDADVAPASVPVKGCTTSSWRYVSTSRGADKLVQFGPIQANRNRTGSTSSTTFTSQVGGTATATFSGSTNVKGSVKVLELAATFGVSASLSLTASLGNSTTIKVPTGKTGYGAYGVWQIVAKGKESRMRAPNCQLESKSASVVAPFRVGWDTWVK